VEPIEVAKELEANGLMNLHLVDLDGARSKRIVNQKILEQLASETNLNIDFGGGLKTKEDVNIAFESGAKQISLGSMAVENRILFREILHNYGSDKVMLGADCKNRQIASNGWMEKSDYDVIPFINYYKTSGVSTVICTDISKDGMLEGPSFELYKEILENYERKNLENVNKVFPIIKNVYENPKNKYERIVVPFTDGKKTMNIVTNLNNAYDSKGKELIDDFEKNITLAIIDETWKTHLRKMDELRQSVQLAVHEQKDPLLIYKFEAKELFFSMIDQLNKDILTFLFKGELPSKNPNEITEDRQTRRRERYNTSKEEILNSDEMANRNREVGASASSGNSVVETIVREQRKIGRNERVKIKNIQTGEVKEVKYKQAEPLIQTGTWILNEN